MYIMVILEEIRSTRETINIQAVIKEAMKIGEVRNFHEALQNSKDTVIVAKVRVVEPLVTSTVRNRLRKIRRIILKLVNIDGSYGDKCSVFLFGELAVDTDTANITIGDRLIFLNPSIVPYSMFERRDKFYQFQIECGLPFYRNQKVILIRKKITVGNESDAIATDITTNEEKDKYIQIKDSDREEAVAPANDSIERQESESSNKTFTQSFSEKDIVGSNFRVPRSNMIQVLTENSSNISTTTHYSYKKLNEIQNIELKVHTYVVVSQVLRILPPTEKQQRMMIFKAVDEGLVLNKKDFVIRIIFEETDEFYKLIKPYSILRLHRMKVNYQDGSFCGLVFKGSDILIFPCNRKNFFKGFTSAKSFTFTDYDKSRLQELSNWVKKEYFPLQSTCKIEWQSLNTIKPDEPFQLYCYVNGVTKSSVTSTTVLHVSDGYTSPLKLYKVPVKEKHWSESPKHFITDLKIVDVIVESPGDNVLRLQKDSYIALGPIKLWQWEVNQDDPISYKMELMPNAKGIRVLDNTDPIVKRLKKAITDSTTKLTINRVNKPHPLEKQVTNSEPHCSKNNQKEGVKEKRKLFNVHEYFNDSEAKRQRSNLDVTDELIDSTEISEEQSKPSTAVRVKSPFEDEMFNFTQTISSSVYADQPQPSRIASKTSDLNPSKQIPNIKRKSNINKNYTFVPSEKSSQILMDENKGSERSDKNISLNDLKTKRIDTMSQESADKCFEELGSMLTKYVQPRSKPVSPIVDPTNSSPKETNTRIEVHEVPSSSSSSSIMVIDINNETEASHKPVDKQRCTTASNNKNEDKVDERKEEQMIVVKYKQLPPGQNGHISIEDGIVEIEVGDKGLPEDAEQITLLSLYNKEQLRKCQLSSGQSSKPEENKSSPRKDCKSNGKENMTNIYIRNLSLIEDFKINENLTHEKQSYLRDKTIERNCMTKHLEPNTPHENSVNSSHFKTTSFVDTIDLCDANTIINESVNKNNRMPSSVAASINNKCYCENDLTDSFHSLHSVQSWLQQAISPPSITEGERDVQHLPYISTTNTLHDNSSDTARNLSLDSFNPVCGVTPMSVFVMEIQPPYEDNPLDLVSGYCFAGCNNLYLFSAFHYDCSKNHVFCPKCIASGKEKPVEMIFALQLTVLTQQGHQMAALLLREHAEKFLGCTVERFLNCSETRSRVVEILSRIKYNHKRSTVPTITMCFSNVHNQILASNTTVLQTIKNGS